MPPVATGSSNGETNGASASESSASARRPSFDFRIQKGQPEISSAFHGKSGSAVEDGEAGVGTPPNELVASGVSHDRVKHFFGTYPAVSFDVMKQQLIPLLSSCVLQEVTTFL